MRLWLIVAVTIAALGAASPGLAAKKHSTVRCPPHGQKVVLSNSVAVLFGDGGDTWGCMRPHGKARLLFASDEYDLGGAPRLAGHFAAYIFNEIDPCSKYAQCPPGQPDTTTTIGLIDLGSGHRAGSSAQDNIVAFKLASVGVAVWTNSAADGTVSVRTLDRHSRTTTLDSGTIDPKSLAVHGATVSWTKAGAPQSATLAR